MCKFLLTGCMEIICKNFIAKLVLSFSLWRMVFQNAKKNKRNQPYLINWYMDSKIRVCGKNSIPLKFNLKHLNRHAAFLFPWEQSWGKNKVSTIRTIYILLNYYIFRLIFKILKAWRSFIYCVYIRISCHTYLHSIPRGVDPLF